MTGYRDLVFAWVAVVCAAGQAAAAEGRYVAADAELLLDATELVFRGEGPGAGTGVTGTVHPGAFVGLFAPRSCRLAVAVDAPSAAARGMSLLRLDFTGRGAFAGGPVVPLKNIRTHSKGTLDDATFGPVVLQRPASDDGPAAPVTVRGTYARRGAACEVRMTAVVALEARCRFGERTFPVRILDGTGDLAANDPLVPVRMSGKTVGIVPGDTVAVDVGDGSFAKAKDVVRAYLGQPVHVRGAWYAVSAGADGRSIHVAPRKLATGYVRVGHPKWQAVLVGGESVFPVHGGAKPVAVPAGRYMVVDYRQYEAAESGDEAAGGRRGRLVCNGRAEVLLDTAKAYEVRAGATADLPLGSPVRVTLQTLQEGPTVRLVLDLRDSGGTRVSELVLVEGPLEHRSPNTPIFLITDGSGKRVYQASLTHG